MKTFGTAIGAMILGLVLASSSSLAVQGQTDAGGVSGQSSPSSSLASDIRSGSVTTVTSPQIVEGDVVRADQDSYVIRDISGHERRIYYDRRTVRENINVGDHVVVQFDEPMAPYAASISKRPSATVLPGMAPGPGILTPGATLPRPQTIEGEVLRVNPDNYVIRDVSGREVRIHFDRTSKIDGNITAGDKVVARLVAPAETAASTRRLYKLDEGDALIGQVVRIDGDTYIVRDANGTEHRVLAESPSLREPSIAIGDRVLVTRAHSYMPHAESITKR